MYKVEYSKAKYDRWGHEVCSSTFTLLVDDLDIAINRAKEISSKRSKHDVNVYDLNGPEIEGGKTWLLLAFKAGNVIWDNRFEYNKAKVEDY